MTNPLTQRDAQYVDDIERTAERLAENDERLQSGQINQEEHARSLAEATRQVAEIAAQNPDSAPVQTSVARTYIQAGNFEKAVAHASQAMALAPNDPFPITTRGLAYFQAGDYGQAAEDAKRALAADPKDPVAWSLHMLSKDRIAKAADPATPKPGATPGLSERSSEPMSLPENPYASRPTLRPDDDPEIARYKTEEGRDYARKVVAAEKAVKRKDYLTAFGLANAALSTYADNPRVLATRAAAAWNLRDFRTTASDATAVLKAYPDMPLMLTARAGAYNELGRHTDALKDAEKAVALAPNKARALLERAIAKEGLRDPAANVLADFRQAAEFDSRYKVDYERALARLAPQEREAALTATGAGIESSNSPSRRGTSAKKSRAPFSGLHLLAGVGGFLGIAAAGLLLTRRG